MLWLTLKIDNCVLLIFLHSVAELWCWFFLQIWCVGLFLVVGTALSGILCERVWSESELGISQIEGRGQGKGLHVPLCLTAGGSGV